MSLKTSGGKANPPRDMNGKPSKHHVMIFNVADTKNHPDVQMTQGGMLLYALLVGGDYDRVFGFISILIGCSYLFFELGC